MKCPSVRRGARLVRQCPQSRCPHIKLAEMTHIRSHRVTVSRDTSVPAHRFIRASLSLSRYECFRNVVFHLFKHCHRIGVQSVLFVITYQNNQKMLLFCNIFIFAENVSSSYENRIAGGWCPQQRRVFWPPYLRISPHPPLLSSLLCPDAGLFSGPGGAKVGQLWQNKIMTSAT